MLAGIVISVVVVAGLAVAVPWLVSQRDALDMVDGEPQERFSPSMRIVHRDVEDFAESLEGPEVSTPLTRAAELIELQLLSRQAAGRRARTAATLAVLTVVMAGVAAWTDMPWSWVLVPLALLLAFLVASPLMVRAMNRRFDVRAAHVREGFDDAEHTQLIELDAVNADLADDAAEESAAITVDLSGPEHSGSLWDAVPVTTPTYVSKPLVPRSVRTIDLSSPVPATPSVVPTADNPAGGLTDGQLATEASEVSGAAEATDPGSAHVAYLRPRAVGE